MDEIRSGLTVGSANSPDLYVDALVAGASDWIGPAIVATPFVPKIIQYG